MENAFPIIPGHGVLSGNKLATILNYQRGPLCPPLIDDPLITLIMTVDVYLTLAKSYIGIIGDT